MRLTYALIASLLISSTAFAQVIEPQGVHSTQDVGAPQAPKAQAPAKGQESSPFLLKMQDKAQGKSAVAQKYMALSYDLGIGVPNDSSREVELLTRAANNGDTEAMYMLGKLYEEGHGVHENFTTALSLYLKAADLGDVTCQELVGRYYFEGTKVQRNLGRAFEYYKLAALQDSPSALEFLAREMMRGENLGRNVDQAIVLYERAASLGSPRAAVTLAMLYAQGEGVEYNLAKAQQYAGLACKGGVRLACDFEKQMRGGSGH